MPNQARNRTSRPASWAEPKGIDVAPLPGADRDSATPGVWHEDLILLAGRTRGDEVAVGRA